MNVLKTLTMTPDGTLTKVIDMDRKYIIKTPYGAYIGLHSNGMELNFLMTKLEDAPRFSIADVKIIKLNFKTKWEEAKLAPFELVLVEKPVTGIF